MARRPDPPELQAEKGYPRRRQSKTDKQIAQAEEIAALLAAAPHEGGLSPPALLMDPRCAGALKVWREYAPQLTRLHLLRDTDRHTFAVFCVAVAEYTEAHLDIITKGYSQAVPAVAGGKMERLRPSVKRREAAQATIMELATRFGLTPTDYYNLMHRQSQAPAKAHQPTSLHATTESDAAP